MVCSDANAAAAVDKMDFAIDETPRVTQSRAPDPPPPAPAVSPTAVLLGSKPVRMEAAKQAKKPVEILIRDLYEENGKLLIRYAVRNQGTRGGTNLKRRRSTRSTVPDTPSPYTP